MKKILLLILMSTFLVACSEIETEQKVEETIEEGGAYSESKKETSPSGLDSTTPNVLSKHDVKIETLNIKDSVKLITGKTHILNGYVSSNSLKKDETNSTMSIKIPKESATEMKELIHDSFNVTEENITSVDVKDKQLDLDSKIKSIEEREERLRQLYKDSNSVEEIMSIDERLYEVSIEKDELLNQKEKIKDRSSYSKINIELKEVKKIKEETEESLILKETKKSMSLIVLVIEGILVLLIKSFPVLLFISIIVGLFIFYKIMKKKRYNNNR